MRDAASGSIWSSLAGRALVGPLAGAQLKLLPLQTTTWEAWLADHPDTTTPLIETVDEYYLIGPGGHVYAREDDPASEPIPSGFRDSLPDADGRLLERDFVIGVLAGNEARAFPVASLPSDAPMQGTVGGLPVVVLEDADGAPALAFHRRLTDGRELEFRRDGGAVVDAQTGSRWSASGLAVAGDLKGVQLAFVPSFRTQWYGWVAFYPETTIYAPTD